MKLKKMIACILSLCMLATMMPVTVLAEESTGLPAAENGVITLTQNVELTETFKVTGELTLDLADYTISGTDSATGNFALIEIQPGAELTIKGNGAITLEAENDRDWNAYSSVISNQRGTLTVEGGTIEHKGGTDMAYAIDNLTNGKNTSAKTTIEGGVIKSTYRAIRQFLDGTEAENTLIVNGGTIEGGNKSIWMQDPSKNANSGTLTVSEDATLKGDVYLYVTEGSTEWPVSVSIANEAFDGESTVKTGNVPANSAVAEVGGTWGVFTADDESGEETPKVPVAVVDGKGYSDLQEAIDEAEDGDTITLLADCDGDVTVKQAENVKIIIDGNDHTFTGTITVDGKSARYETAGITIKNVNFDATNIEEDACINLGESGNSNTRYTNNVTVQDCTFTGSNCEKVAIKSYTGGDWNLTVSGCTADDTMHSLLQVTNVEKGLVIEGCTVESKNGINLNETVSAEITNNVFDVSGYAVRSGVNSGDTDGPVKNIVLANNTLRTDNSEGDAVIVLRASAANMNLTMEENGVSGDTHISGITGETTVSAEGNYWDGNSAPTVDGVAVEVETYYTDYDFDTRELSNLVDPNAPVDPEPTPTPAKKTTKKYSVSIDSDEIENGSIKLSSSKAKKGATVTLTVTPDVGYELDKLVVLDDDGDKVELTDKGNGKFTFKMPRGGVEVEASFVEIEGVKVDDEIIIVLTIDETLMLIDGEYVVNDVAPIIRGERTVLPIRVIAEALGATVSWNEAEQTVTIVKGEMTIVLYIGQAFALVNGEPVSLDQPAFIENGRTYLPLRFIMENLGAEVTWDALTQKVTIVG